MLPYTPLHYLLLRQLRFPVVATSGNLSDETICIDESEALERLRGIADMFLVHDRPITRHVDDSIVRVVAGREMVVRRARGFAPLPLDMDEEVGSILAVGAHQKNSIAASSGKQIFMSQHIGDLDTPQSSTAFKGVISSLEELYEISPDVVACDLHPDYLSTRYACDTALPRVKVQHHYAHILACMAENHLLDASVLGVAWDGTGFGDDGTIWGGEFLRITGESYTREAHFRTFPLPGGDKAAREPRRTALGVLYELSGDTALAAVLPTLRAFQPRELVVMRRMLTNQLNCPRTSSVGRLFDAVASVAGIRQMAGYEGQAAMELEFAVGSLRTDESYDFEVIEQLGGPAIIDWGRAVSELIDDVVGGVHRRIVAARFHNMLVETIVVTAKDSGIANVALSGGCFQNKYLLERTVTRLKSEGFRPYWHQRVPPNDGGIALGQTIAAIRAQAAAKKERKGEWQNVFSCTR